MAKITDAAAKSHAWPVRVYYEDTDAGGIVYHASYLRFAERARTEMLRAMGFSHADVLRDEGVAFTVRRMEIDFLSPAKLDDSLVVKTEVRRISGASLDLAQVIEREGSGAIVSIALQLACLDANTLKATRLPEALRRLFQERMQPAAD